jgi:hypothetical protein
MPLTKTTIVPPGSADPILALPILKMVVVVADPAIAQKADDGAQFPPIVDRQVIWFPGSLPAHYQAQFHVPDLATALAFSLSPTNGVGDVIRQGEVVDDIRMEVCYTNAGV